MWQLIEKALDGCLLLSCGGRCFDHGLGSGLRGGDGTWRVVQDLEDRGWVPVDGAPKPHLHVFVTVLMRVRSGEVKKGKEVRYT